MAASKPLLVVVADRAHAHVYETPRPGATLERIATIGNPNARLHERDLGTYAPGRSFNRSAGIHQTYATEHTRKQHEAERFARVVGKTVALSLRSARCGGVVLVASPRLLSAIRRSLSKATREKIVREIPKDLVHRPKRAITNYLADYLASARSRTA